MSFEWLSDLPEVKVPYSGWVLLCIADIEVDSELLSDRNGLWITTNI